MKHSVNPEPIGVQANNRYQFELKDIFQAFAFLAILEGVLFVYVRYVSKMGFRGVPLTFLCFIVAVAVSVVFGLWIQSLWLSCIVVAAFWSSAFVLDAVFSKAHLGVLARDCGVAFCIHMLFQAAVVLRSRS